MDWLSLMLAAGTAVLACVTACWLTRNDRGRFLWLSVAWGLIMAAYRNQVTPAVIVAAMGFVVGTTVWAVAVARQKHKPPGSV
ncbi:MAG: hypothetical protein ABIX28_15935 [Vicinamibacterales bacterium]